MKRSDTKALVANISFGVSAAAVIAAGVLWFTDGPDGISEETALAPTITSDGAGIAFAGRF